MIDPMYQQVLIKAVACGLVCKIELAPALPSYVRTESRTGFEDESILLLRGTR